jgi:hypothetical protein
MINFSWNLIGVRCVESEQGLNNVVESIEWEYYGCDENGVDFTHYGVLNVGPPDPNNFIEYGDLSKSDLITWLENNYDMDGFRSYITSIIISKSTTKKTISLPPPN